MEFVFYRHAIADEGCKESMNVLWMCCAMKVSIPCMR